MSNRSSRSTIGSNNPLDSVVPRSGAPAGDSAPEPTIEPDARRASSYVRQTRKERLTVHLPTPLIERVKNAVYWTPGMTLASLGEQALEAEIERLEHQRGEPFPQRSEDLRGGRPMK